MQYARSVEISELLNATSIELYQGCLIRSSSVRTVGLYCAHDREVESTRDERYAQLWLVWSVEDWAETRILLTESWERLDALDDAERAELTKRLAGFMEEDWLAIATQVLGGNEDWLSLLLARAGGSKVGG